MTDEFDLTISDSFRTPGRRKNNWTASASPTVNDDEGDGYEEGSVWLDGTGRTVWILIDPSLGAAVWEQFIPGGESGETLHVDTSVSGAHTIDRADGGTHDLTLTGNATFTLTGAFTGRATDLRIILRQDGTGNRTVTWPGTVDWVNGVAPTLQTAAGALDVIGLLSVDDGATWLGFYNRLVASLDDLTDVVITSPTTGEALIYNGSQWVNGDVVASLDDLTDVTITAAADGDELIFTGTVWEDRPGSRHSHIVGEAQTGDGSTTVFYLAQEAEADTVAAYVAGSRTDVTQDTTTPDKLTFSVAPSAAAAIRFDYIPVTG